MNNTFCGIHCNPSHCPFGRRPKFIECSLVASPLIIVIQSYYKHGSGIRHHTAACVVCLRGKSQKGNVNLSDVLKMSKLLIGRLVALTWEGVIDVKW